jgi:phosphate transport system substrate-binding protein
VWEVPACLLTFLADLIRMVRHALQCDGFWQAEQASDPVRLHHEVSGVTQALPLPWVTLAVALLLTGCLEQSRPSGDQQSPAVIGAGATFPAPLYQRWFTHLLVREELSISYRPSDSAAGERQLQAGQVDFAGSDRPTALRHWLQIPTTAGAIAVAYNHPGCELRLNPEQLRQILTGSISNYSQLKCPPAPLKVVVRSDSSGTTANVLHYLQVVTEQPWHLASAQVVDSNEEMATALMQSPGAIGYLDTVYLQGRFKLRAAELKNPAGRFVPPDAAAIDLALQQWPQSREGYPLVTPTWLLVPKSGLGRKAAVIKQALVYGLSAAGQQEARSLGYAPLPRLLQQQAVASIGAIQP